MLPDFSLARVLVIGDLMLDRYLLGKVRRISPEAPVPVVHVQSTKDALGGAANVAANVTGLGASCTLVGAVGDDEAGKILRALLPERGIRPVLVEDKTPTVTKTRVMADHQQVVRLDVEDPMALSNSAAEQLVTAVADALPGHSVLVLSDYGKGVCSPAVCQRVIALAHSAGIPVFVDPKTADWERYRGADLVTPNLKEFCEALGQDVVNLDSAVESCSRSLRQRFGVSELLVTRSERGMTLAHRDGSHQHIHAQAREVFDVSGAGDTVIATLAVAVAAGADIEDAVRIANRAAGIVVGKAGTVPIRLDDLQAGDQESAGRKVLERQALCRSLEESRAKGRRIVFTNGCFDILHRGHVTYLAGARALGDLLVVGLNSDASVRRLKGEGRPVNGEEDRAAVLASLACVDLVCIFPEDTPEALLSDVRPDVLVKGGDYRVEDILGREFAKEVRVLPFLKGHSTTQTLQKLQG